MLVIILGGIALLGITIIVHELGHLLLGRLVGIKAEIFSIGFGKGIWKVKFKDTTYQITAFPFGGYVKFYGDDYAQDYHNVDKVSYGFFSKPPLIRIIPVIGGPLFNLILGFLLFFVVGFLPKDNPPMIYLWDEMENSPAKLSGLKNGDYVLSINGKPVDDFKDIQETILLSGGQPLDFQIKRIENQEEKILNITVIPEVDSTGRSQIGIRIPGERKIQVDFPFVDLVKFKLLSLFQKDVEPTNYPAMKYFKDGDVIIEVEGKKVQSTSELQELLGGLDKEVVNVKVEREKYPWLVPWFKETLEIQVPFRKEYRITFRNVKDLKYNQTIEEIQLLSYVPEHLRALNFLQIEGITTTSFEEIYKFISKNQNQKYRFRIGSAEFEANLSVSKIGLMGFRPNNVIEQITIPKEASLVGAISYAYENTIQNIMIYPKFFQMLFTGRISFIDNTMGPVGMFALAGIVIETDFRDYLILMASISIALMVINLIPFPIVDGGHIVLFLIEAIRGKKLPLSLIENLHRVAFIILLSLGLWIMFRDVLFVLGL
ncbi:MAG: site-2 protease family protein [Leptospiraceae bacterium]|nr:site-2 protease family protein [Leptospiraceae bacterium]MDW7976694.1 site-2 protease family protein [Leptospiraceae bacterium]